MKNLFLSYSYRVSRYTGISLTCFTILFAILCLLVSGCKEPTTPLEVTNGDNFENTHLMKTGFDPNDPLMPTGNSTTDTENLQEALHDVSLDAGGTLYLGPGIFRIHRFVGRQNLSDQSDPSYSNILFNGTIQGAGKGVTILRGVRGPGGVSFEPLHYEIDGLAYDDHTLLGVVQTYVGVRDLTFDSESQLVDPYNSYGDLGLVNFVSTGSFEPGLNSLIGTDIINVHFKGSLNLFGLPETAHLFQQWGDKSGVHNIKGCEFENSQYGALQFINLDDATINIGGRPNEKVTLTNCVKAAVQIGGCYNCDLNVSRLETYDAAGIYFFPGLGNIQSSLNITNSVINCRPGSYYAGVELWGRSGDIEVVISNNNIHSEDSWLWGPIFSDGAMDNGVITANKFSGRGPSAIYLDVTSWRTGSATLTDNKFDNWEITNSNPWGLPAAHIWFGPFFVNSTVKGGGAGVYVFDEPAYDTDWNPLYDENDDPLTIPGYGDLIPPEEFSNLVLKNNTFKGVSVIEHESDQGIRSKIQSEVEQKKKMMKQLKRR